MKRSVTVEVAGQKLNLKTDADESYVRSLAAFVDEKMGEVKSSTRIVATQSIALLTALNIADDLFRLRKKDGELRKAVRERGKVILSLLDKV